LSARTRASLAQTASAIEAKLRLRGQEGFPGGGKKVTTLKEERKSDKETLKKGEAACSSSAFQASSGDSEQSTDENHTNISARPRAVIESVHSQVLGHIRTQFFFRLPARVSADAARVRRGKLIGQKEE